MPPVPPAVRELLEAAGMAEFVNHSRTHLIDVIINRSGAYKQRENDYRAQARRVRKVENRKTCERNAEAARELHARVIQLMRAVEAAWPSELRT